MKNVVQYFSTDKMYTLGGDKKISKTYIIGWLLLIVALLSLVFGIFKLSRTFFTKNESSAVSYSETGKADYTVYLKENSYYNSKYLESGMQYVASLINTINASFNYEVHSDKNLNYDYTYKITGTLEILDKDNPGKVLFTKPYVLLKETTKKANSNNFVINEDVNIDYDTYNNYVNSYKREYGLSVQSRLIITMDVSVDGVYDKGVEHLDKDSSLQITIPLSEQTLNITIDKENINNNGDLLRTNAVDLGKAGNITISLVAIVVSIVLLLVSRKLFVNYKKDNIYAIVVNKILKDYDKLIVSGKGTIQEDKYPNIIYPESFEEMVDASLNLQSPILFYNVIPGEKCFFVIVKDDTLYKYRITRAYQEKALYQKNNKDNDVTSENSNITNNQIDSLNSSDNNQDYNNTNSSYNDINNNNLNI